MYQCTPLVVFHSQNVLLYLLVWVIFNLMLSISITITIKNWTVALPNLERDLLEVRLAKLLINEPFHLLIRSRHKLVGPIWPDDFVRGSVRAFSFPTNARFFLDNSRGSWSCWVSPSSIPWTYIIRSVWNTHSSADFEERTI